MAAKRVRLAQRRKAAGYSQEDLAELLGVERSTIVRWEGAATEPQPWLRPKLAEALNIPPEKLQALLDDVAVVRGPSDERLQQAVQDPARVDLVAVAQLHERVRRLDEQYDALPSTALLGPAGHVHAHIRVLRDHARDRRVRRSLFEVEAESATFMSQLVWDVSQRRDHTAPLGYLDEAIACARQARDPATEAYATLRKSFLALYGVGDPEEGVARAAEAADIARQTSPALTGLALLHVAEGHAMRGDLADCEAALGSAEKQFDRVTPDDVGADYYTVNEFNRLAGSCYLALNLPERAEPILRTTAASLAAKKKSQAIAYGNLTLSLIRQNKRDEAGEAMHHTIDAVELTRGGGGLNLAFTAGRELRRWQGEPWVQDVQDRLLALMAAV
ncbi:transcriptional repressor DicA [Actinomadura rubteroloni]|uniref:Transcriptional repressor DicA n=1 Tax=Actinomadura rubteroloni TaxID=1926885 RepID=A0A2P4UFG7_9ACTN|nr:helix-turn-helix transcriptional regulator [Actinomadura rubteroloni]POM23803.1 transcriptional repressor DicA [Actinomadura rubteroloni]